MPPSERNNADERIARIELLLEELRATVKGTGKPERSRARTRRVVRQAKAGLAPKADARTGKKR